MLQKKEETAGEIRKPKPVEKGESKGGRGKRGGTEGGEMSSYDTRV